jgi:hypothetical protein
MLRSYERKSWKVYRGIAEIEPFGPNQALGTIKNRINHWFKESLRRLVVTPGVSSTGHQLGRRGYRNEVRAWMRGKGIDTIERAAARLAVSKDTLKSIMSSKGKPKYGPDTLKRIVDEITPPETKG